MQNLTSNDNNSKYKAVAIDGPSGAGKSTVAKKLAQILGYAYVDTGALYRAIGFFMVENNICPQDEECVTENLKNINIEIQYQDNVQHVFLNNIDVTDKIRTSQISAAASSVSAYKSVRDFLFDLQRNIARNNNVIMDGRDIATVVLPNADVKIFLTASEESRAERRFKELILTDDSVSFEKVLKDIIARDHNDSSRKIAPLMKTDDAILVDSSNMNFDETLKFILDIITERLFL